MTKRWRVAEPCPEAFFGTVAEVPRPVAQALWNRGIRTTDEAHRFLAPDFTRDIHAPFQFRHMRAVVDRIFQALNAGERITVHGDYDADGVTGSTVLLTTLRMLAAHLGVADAPIDHYIPHRDKEGYGLHRGTVPKLEERGTKLLITVDCGIACVEEIAEGKRRGMETVVVDHHQFGATLPDGQLIHPSVPEETYPFKSLAAVGVSYKVAHALIEEGRARGLPIPDGAEKWLLDLVAIATVTDMVPLVGENRALLAYGLKVLNKTRRPGLRMLIEAARLVPGTIRSEDIAFMIGPRLNAAGRMDHAELALHLLLAADEVHAKPYLEKIERCNRERQETTRRMMDEAETLLAGKAIQRERAVFLAAAHWSPALVGLIAGKLLERFSRPVAIVGAHGGTWIGSGRSYAPFDITDAVRTSGEGVLSRVGGHLQACGFSVAEDAGIPVLEERFYAHAASRVTDEMMVPELVVDARVSLADLSLDLWEQIERMEPFGEGNRRPVFVAERVPVVVMDTVGAQRQHLRLTVLNERGMRVKAIGFKMGPRLAELPMGGELDLAFHVDQNEWNGRRELQLKLVDVRASKSFTEV